MGALGCGGESGVQSEGSCATPADCDDGDPCTLDSCSADGACAYAYANADCDDGDPCTTNDICDAGVCSGNPVVCDDPPYACAPGGGEAGMCVDGSCIYGVPGGAEISPLGSYEVVSGAADVAFLDDATLLALGVGALELLDVSDPAVPVVGSSTAWGGNALGVTGSSLYTTTPTGASNMSVRITSLADLSNYDDYSVGPRAATRLAPVGSWVYVASGNGVLAVDTLADQPLLGTIGLLGAVQDVAVMGDLVLAAATAGGLVVIDVSSFPSDVPQGMASSEGDAIAVFALDPPTVLVGGSAGLATFVVGGWDDVEQIGCARVEGRIFLATEDTVYVIGERCADSTATEPGLHVFDISDPTDIRFTACARMPEGTPLDIRETPTGGRGLAMQGDLFALASSEAVVFFTLATSAR